MLGRPVVVRRLAPGTLGNLTCTAFNSEMGNCSFREKRDAERGFRNSPLRLNEDLRQAERWDEPAIRARAARLADLAVEIWRRPVLTDRVLASYETPRTGAGGYTIEHHPHLRPGAPMHDLFEAVRQAILALGPQVRKSSGGTMSPTRRRPTSSTWCRRSAASG